MDLEKIEAFVVRMRSLGAMQVVVEGVSITFCDVPEVPRLDNPFSPVGDTVGPESSTVEDMDMSPGPGSEMEKEAIRRRVLTELQESLP